MVEPVKEVTFFNDKKIVVLPSYNVKNEFISAVILPTKGYSYLDSKRFSDEKINLFLAFLSFHHMYVKLSDNTNLPLIVTNNDLSKENLLKKLEKFYPDGQEISSKNKYEKTYIVNWLYDAFNKIENKEVRRKVLNIIFSYYSGIENNSKNKTLSLVAFIACMSSIAKLLEPAYASDNGDRKTIVYFVSNILNYVSESNEYKLLDKWSKRVYNDHRSSYVHGANHRFESYSQNMDGNNFAGLPKALPSQNMPVSKQYKYESDFKIAVQATEVMIIACLEKLSGISSEDIDIKKDINFKIEDMAEGYIGMINKGWVRLTY